MSETLAATLAGASAGARAMGHDSIRLEHLLRALCDDPDAIDVLNASHIDIERLKEDTTGYLAGFRSGPAEQSRRLTVSPDVTRILEAASAAAQGGRRREINGAIVLAAIIGDGQSIAAEILKHQGLTFDGAIAALQRAMQPQARPQPQPQAVPPAYVTPAEDVLARARERVMSRAAPSLRDLMKGMPRNTPPPPLPQSTTSEPLFEPVTAPDSQADVDRPEGDEQGEVLTTREPHADGEGWTDADQTEAAADADPDAAAMDPFAPGTPVFDAATGKHDGLIDPDSGDQPDAHPHDAGARSDTFETDTPDKPGLQQGDAATDDTPAHDAAFETATDTDTDTVDAAAAQPIQAMVPGQPPQPAEAASSVTEATPAEASEGSEAADVSANEPATSAPASAAAAKPLASTPARLPVPPLQTRPPGSPSPRPTQRQPMPPSAAPAPQAGWPSSASPDYATPPLPTPTQPRPAMPSAQAADPIPGTQTLPGLPIGATARSVMMPPPPIPGAAFTAAVASASTYPGNAGLGPGQPPTGSPQFGPGPSHPRLAGQAPPLPTAAGVSGPLLDPALLFPDANPGPVMSATGAPRMGPLGAKLARSAQSRVPPPPRSAAAPLDMAALAAMVTSSYQVSKTERVELRIRKSEALNIVEGAQGGSRSWQHEIIARTVSVRLKAPEAGLFVEAASPETQWIDADQRDPNEDYASWRFFVTPSLHGGHRLQLMVSGRSVGADGVVAETALPDQMIEVHAKRDVRAIASRWFTRLLAATAGGIAIYFREEITTALLSLQQSLGA